MKKILVPTDFSPNSAQALEIAAKIAVQTNAQLEVLHVNTAGAYAPILPEFDVVPEETFDRYATTVIPELHALKRNLSAVKGLEQLQIETRVEEGFLHTTLKRIAAEDQCDLLVMGTKGSTGATEFFIGSNTEKVIRTANCPVLVVPSSTKTFGLKTVVLATTLAPDQAAAFDTITAWQKHYDFEVKVLYLNNPGGFADMSAIYTALDQFCGSSGMQNADLFTADNIFNEEQAILSFATEHQADLIVMATHQRRGVSHMMFGSLTEDTANHSETPVLCIPIYLPS